MLLSRIAEFASQAATQVKREYTETFNDLGVRIVKLHESGLFACQYPTKAKNHWIATRLNMEHDSRYLLLNFSGTSYNTESFAGPVLDVTMNGSVPPLDVMIQLCTALSCWLGSDSNSVVVAHGAEHNPEVVAFFFGCFLSWMGWCPHPRAGYFSVADPLNFSEASLLPSHKRYFQYFELMQRGFTPQSVVLSGFEVSGLGFEEESDTQHLTAELRQEGRLIKRFSSFDAMDPVFDLEEPLGGDVTITVWDTYISEGLAVGSGKPIVQVSFHTGFVSGDEGLYFPQSELDHVPASVKRQMPDIGVKMSLCVGSSQDTLAAERLALQVLLGAEKRPVNEIPTTDLQPANVDIEEFFHAKSSSIENLFDGNFDVVKAADIEDLFDKNFDTINDVQSGDHCKANGTLAAKGSNYPFPYPYCERIPMPASRFTSAANVEKTSTKVAPQSDLEDFFRELDDLVKA
eukprot:gnl/MRDRNA2_/MRDRNA2_42132_c0_seq1.p1 gnl/MRDRNA2_/MRDRNA2_42132_c0~~gnl/MRDRNA2_/MRDRNA2_42132_c0_seq1.p1  ORF type:complete len:460 (+),score=90.98 gnl/MRDRNA2_/MRDRNA2_42132_c0_seq1:76-1455(+)